MLFFNVSLKIGDPFSNNFLPISKMTSLHGGTQVIYWLQMTFMHHIITEELRLEETFRGHLVHFLAQAGPLRASYPGLEYFQEWRLRLLLRKHLPALGHAQQ